MMFDDVILIVNYFIYLLCVGLVIIEMYVDKILSLFNKLMYNK